MSSWWRVELAICGNYGWKQAVVAIEVKDNNDGNPTVDEIWEDATDAFRSLGFDDKDDPAQAIGLLSYERIVKEGDLDDLDL